MTTAGALGWTGGAFLALGLAPLVVSLSALGVMRWHGCHFDIDWGSECVIGGVDRGPVLDGLVGSIFLFTFAGAWLALAGLVALALAWAARGRP